MKSLYDIGLKEQGLNDLIKLIESERVEKFAEVGVWAGKTIQNILSDSNRSCMIKEYWAIDSWDLVWNEIYRHVCSYMMRFPQLKVIRLSSLEAVGLFPKGYLDLVLIDADHGYEAVKKDIKAWYPIVKKNGYLCGDDYSNKRWRGVRKAVNELFTDVETYSGRLWIIRKDD